MKKLERGFEEPTKWTSNQIDPNDPVPDQMQKRALSRQTSLSNLNQDTASQRSQASSISNSFYRYHILDRAKVYIHPELPPPEIQVQMNAIFNREIPEERRRAISDIAKETSQNFIINLRAAHREDDLVELIYDALRMMHKDDTLQFARKEGIALTLAPIYTPMCANLYIDWAPSLKPTIQHTWNFHASRQSNEANDTFDHPKTPRPNFTIGLRHSTITNALVKRGLSEYKATSLLEELQHEQILCSDPTQHSLNIRFPLLVIEGKAYATGKTAFEAQNQAAIPGSSMVNLQQRFINLSTSIFPNVPRKKSTPLAFSICSEGPQIEFWVHYAVLRDNVRCHYMNIFRTCYGSLQGGLEDFLVDMERLMRWTKETFLEEVADQLLKLAEHYTQR